MNLSHKITLTAKKVLQLEAEAIARLAEFIDEGFQECVEAILSIKGRVVVTGIGKSGHIARKIAATMCSTGTAALYLHPSEASHGDLGIISEDDVVLAITWSGETAELGDIFNFCQLYGLPLVVATANKDSTAARAADICLTLPSVREACPNSLAPTTSTTLQLVIGDALAVALIEARGFSPGDFRVFHPGGRLGAQLTIVSQVMGTGEAVPRVRDDATLSNATIEMNRKRYGCTAVVDNSGKLVGAFTDGDLRRCIAVHDLQDPIRAHMSRNPVAIDSDILCSEALAMMNENAVSVLFVTEAEQLLGIVHMHDIVRLGLE